MGKGEEECDRAIRRRRLWRPQGVGGNGGEDAFRAIVSSSEQLK